MNAIEELKAMHQRKEFAVKDLAAATGKTAQTIYRALSGEIDPPHSVAVLYLEKAVELSKEREPAA